MSYMLREAAAFGSLVLLGASFLMWGEVLAHVLP